MYVELSNFQSYTLKFYYFVFFIKVKNKKNIFSFLNILKIVNKENFAFF